MIFQDVPTYPQLLKKLYPQTGSGQLVNTPLMAEMTFMSSRRVATSTLHDWVLLWTDLLLSLWFSTTEQLTGSEWAFPTFPRNGGCLSLCQTLGRFKKSKFNRWLLRPWLIAVNGSSGYLLSVWWCRPTEKAIEKKGWRGPTLESVVYKGFYSTLALSSNDIFNWFEQILMTGSNVSHCSRKMGVWIDDTGTDI